MPSFPAATTNSVSGLAAIASFHTLASSPPTAPQAGVCDRYAVLAGVAESRGNVGRVAEIVEVQDPNRHQSGLPVDPGHAETVVPDRADGAGDVGAVTLLVGPGARVDLPVEGIAAARRGYEVTAQFAVQVGAEVGMGSFNA